MKTMKFLFVLFVISALTAGTINAQPPVIKFEWTFDISGQPVPCTGDIMAPGSFITSDIMLTPNSYLIFNRDVTVIGFPSGKEYELGQTQVVHKGGKFVNHLDARYEGKLIAVGQILYHITTNANGEVTAEVYFEKFICK